MWASLATSLVALVGEMVHPVDTGIQVWNSVEVNQMVNDPESGFGEGSGLVFDNTTFSELNTNTSAPLPISNLTQLNSTQLNSMRKKREVETMTNTTSLLNRIGI